MKMRTVAPWIIRRRQPALPGSASSQVTSLRPTPLFAFFLVSLLLAAFADRLAAASIPITSVQGFPNERYSNDLPKNAIDGDTATFTWTTQSYNTQAPSYLAIGFSRTTVNRLRLWKRPDGGGGEDIKNLVIEYANDTAEPLSARVWNKVSGLRSGFEGKETMNADINAYGYVTGDKHNSDDVGWASLTFDPVQATALRIGFRSPNPGLQHYRVGEFQAHFDSATPPPAPTAVPVVLTSVQGFPNERYSDDLPKNAIDGNTATFTWTTQGHNTQAPSYLAVGFARTTINRLRLWKRPDGGGGENIKNLVIEYANDTAEPLSARIWNKVSGLRSGFEGKETLEAEINAYGYVTGDKHNSDNSGWASLTFDPIQATALRIGFRSPNPGLQHYRVGEFQVYSPASSAAQTPSVRIPATSVQAFPNGRNSDDLPTNAIDGNPGTFTWTTQGYNTQAPSYLAIGFSRTTINRLRLWKRPDGGGGENIKNLVIEYANDAAEPLSARAWNKVSGLRSGFDGKESMDAQINSYGYVTGDKHNSDEVGWASLTFDTVQATALRIGFSSPNPGLQHYRVGEFQVYSPGDSGGTTTSSALPPGTQWFLVTSASPLDTIQIVDQDNRVLQTINATGATSRVIAITPGGIGQSPTARAKCGTFEIKVCAPLLGCTTKIKTNTDPLCGVKVPTANDIVKTLEDAANKTLSTINAANSSLTTQATVDLIANFVIQATTTLGLPPDKLPAELERLVITIAKTVLNTNSLNLQNGVKPICGSVGARREACWATAFAGYLPINFRCDSALVGGDDCAGRCGLGCQRDNLKPGAETAGLYTQDCLDHDICQGREGSSSTRCHLQLLEAVDDYLWAELMECRDGNLYPRNLMDQNELLVKFSDTKLAPLGLGPVTYLLPSVNGVPLSAAWYPGETATTFCATVGASGGTLIDFKISDQAIAPGTLITRAHMYAPGDWGHNYRGPLNPSEDRYFEYIRCNAQRVVSM